MSAQTALRPRAPCEHGPLYRIVVSPKDDPYTSRVQRVYDDSPATWQQVLGPQLWFQFGLYPDLHADTSLDDAGRLYLDHQLQLAGFDATHPPRAILDVGCGWGAPLIHLADRFPGCLTLDGVNISAPQLEHAQHQMMLRGLQPRIALYLCNAQDIDLLPRDNRPYDLILYRGSITHFPYSVLEQSLAHARTALHPDGKLVISDNLYNLPLSSYRSPIADETDRIACGHRKTVDYLRDTLQAAGFRIDDLRVMPSAAETCRWLHDVRRNIEQHLPSARPAAIEELYVSCENQILAIQRGLYSVYSIVASPRL